MRYKHMNINLLYSEMIEDLEYIKRKAVFLKQKNNR
jgi:hypothetical protein